MSYSYALRPEMSGRWEALYGPGIERVSVIAFAAELPEAEPVLDSCEHDASTWCSYAEASALLDWPVEQDALAGRLEALSVLNAQLPIEC